jgi:hypothetical protein
MLSRFANFAPGLAARSLAALLTVGAFGLTSGATKAHAIEELPFFTPDEIKCQRLAKNASNAYVRVVFNARHDCFIEQMKGNLGLANDCHASVDEGTGYEPTDEALRAAQSKTLADITSACLVVDLSVLGFPAGCNDPDGPPFTAFDLEACTRNSADEIIGELIWIEQPQPTSVVDNPARNCQIEISKKSARLFTAELEARSHCVFKQMNRELDLSIDCRAETDRFTPGTGHSPTDNDIISAHNKVLRELANTCGGIDLEGLGFPNECAATDDDTFTMTALIECMFESHHLRIIDYLDNASPLTKNCGNGIIDDLESCDDGDDIGGMGDICNSYCIVNTTCGGPTGKRRPTIVDALYILRVAVGLESCDPALCDVDSNGFINTSDVLRVLRVVVGLEGPSFLFCPDPVIPGEVE